MVYDVIVNVFHFLRYELLPFWLRRGLFFIVVVLLCGGSQSLTLSLSLCLRVRDDLFRVELDNVVGEEMFYSKVRTETHTHTCLYTYFVLEMNSHSLLKFLLLQKRAWESNKNDIRICRMKGKHEVSGYSHTHLLKCVYLYKHTHTHM